MEEDKRLRWLDVLKGISIILVVIGHIIPSNSIVNVIIYSFHIALFFIISGYLLCQKKYANTKVYFYNRMKKLIYPYFLLSFTMLLIYILYSIVFNVSISIVNLILNILIFNGFFATWFLPCLFLSEQLFFRINKTKYSLYIEIIILLISFIISYIIKGMPDGNVFKLFVKITTIIIRAMIGNFFLYIGYYFKLILDSIRIKKGIMVAISFTTMVLALMVGYFNRNVDLYFLQFGNIILYLITSILIPISLIIIFKNLDIKNSILEYFGKNSLIIMATHMVFVMLFHKTLEDNYLLIIFIVLLLDLLMVYSINKFFSFLIDYNRIKKFLRWRKND